MTAMLPAYRYMETLPWEALYTHGRWRYILETENLNNLVIAAVQFCNQPVLVLWDTQQVQAFGNG